MSNVGFSTQARLLGGTHIQNTQTNTNTYPRERARRKLQHDLYYLARRQQKLPKLARSCFASTNSTYVLRCWVICWVRFYDLARGYCCACVFYHLIVLPTHSTQLLFETIPFGFCSDYIAVCAPAKS